MPTPLGPSYTDPEPDKHTEEKNDGWMDDRKINGRKSCKRRLRKAAGQMMDRLQKER